MNATTTTNISEQKYLEEVIKRAIALCYIGAIGFAFFGIVSLGFIQAFDPTVDFFANFIPRILFNSFPMLALAYILQHTKIEDETKVFLWLFTIPIVLTLSSAIHIFRLITAGHVQIYYFIHGPHLIALMSFLIYLAPPRKSLMIALGLSIVLFLAPHAYFLMKAPNKIFFSLFVSDWILALFATAVTTVAVIELRSKSLQPLAEVPVSTPQQSADKRSPPLPEVKKVPTEVFVLRINLIGLGAFASHLEIDLKRKFLDYYHKNAAKRIADMGGLWHKSDDNSHLATFGLNTEKPGAPMSRTQISEGLQKSLQTVNYILEDFYLLKEELHLPEELSLGLSLDFGTIELEAYTSGRRKHLEISGSQLHLSTRLEEYAHVIKKYFRLKNSVVVLGPGVEKMETRTNHHTVYIDGPDLQVRGYPEIQKVLYLTYPN